MIDILSMLRSLNNVDVNHSFKRRRGVVLGVESLEDRYVLAGDAFEWTAAVGTFDVAANWAGPAAGAPNTVPGAMDNIAGSSGTIIIRDSRAVNDISISGEMKLEFSKTPDAGGGFASGTLSANSILFNDADSIAVIQTDDSSVGNRATFQKLGVADGGLEILKGAGVTADQFSVSGSPTSATAASVNDLSFITGTTLVVGIRLASQGTLYIVGDGTQWSKAQQTYGAFDYIKMGDYDATGVIVVDSGGRLLATKNVAIGINSVAAASTLIVKGQSGMIVRGTLSVGDQGSGALVITNSSELRFDAVGEGANGLAIAVGSNGVGTLTVKAHSLLDSRAAKDAGGTLTNLDVGRIGPLADGDFVVTGGSNVYITGTSFIGGQGQGYLNIEGTSSETPAFFSSGSMKIGNFAYGGNGEVAIGYQGKLEVSDEFRMSSYGLLKLDGQGATAIATNGISLLDTNHPGSPNGIATGNTGITLGELPIIAGQGRIVGDVRGSGKLIPGNDGGPGTLIITGSLTSGDDSVLLADISDQTGDHLEITDTARLGGNLNIKNIGRDLEAGDRFEIVQANTILFDFANIKTGQTYQSGENGLPQLKAGLFWEVRKEGAAGAGQTLVLAVIRDIKTGFNGFDHFDHVVNYGLEIADHDEQLTLNYSIVEGSAQLGTHFALTDPAATSATSGTITFAAHQTTASIQLQVYNFNSEAQATGDRSFRIDLYDDAGDEFFNGVGVIRSFTYSLAFSDNSTIPTFDEGDYTASGIVYLSATPFEGVSINARTEEPISSYDGQDIVPFNGTLYFGAGDAVEYFSLGIIDDNIYERLPEMFDAYLSNPKAGIIAPGHESGIVKIRDNDPIPTLIVDDVEVTVGDAAIFRPRLSNPSAETIVIEYLTYDGSAEEGTDYLGNLGYWYFFAGETVRDTLSIATMPDYQAGTKEFYLTYMSSDFVQVNGGAVGTILDGQEWVEGYWAGNYEYQNLGHMVSRWVGTHWVEDYYVAGHWDGGNWVEGILTGGDWVAGHYEGGTWVDGYYDGSDWVDAHYEGGTFIGGHYDGGTFVSGYYENGAWVEGAWLNDQWVDGHYEGGTFVAGHMEGQVLVPGHMEGQEFVAGHMENQTLIPGHNETPWIDAVYDENGELVSAGHDGEPYWVDDAWVGGNWVDDAWVGGTWVDDAWTGGTWVDDQWIDQTWVDGYYAIQQWIDAHYQQIWIDDHWEGQFWVDDHWENQTWIDGYFANQTWVDAHWENQAWVDGYWINQTWTDGHWENQTWVDAYTAGHWADDYVDEWVDDWQYVWVDLYVEGHWITT